MPDIRHLYVTIPYNRRHQIPKTLLSTMVRERCSDCGQQVLAHSVMLSQTRAECERQGLTLRIVCKKCGDRILGKSNGCLCYTPDTRALAKHFRHG